MKNFRLSEIHITNFFGYENVFFEDLRNYNILIGQNNAGKSNLFKLLVELKNVIQGERLDKNKLFDGNTEKHASISLYFKLNEEFRKKLFTLLKNDVSFANVFKEPEDCPKEWNKDTLNWLIDQGFYDSIEIAFSYYDKWETLIFDRIFGIHKKYAYGSILFEINRYDLNNLSYYLLEKTNLINSNNLRSYFKQGITRRESKINYDVSNLMAFYNRLINKLKDPNSEYYNLLLLKILEEIGYSLFSTNFLQHIPDNRHFIRSSDIINLDKAVPFPDGSNLSKFLANMAINNRPWLDDFIKDLRDFFPYIEEFSSKIEGNSTILHSKEEYLESILRLENLGSGVMNIVLFLIFFKYLSENVIILIEEPELFIYPGLQKKVRDKFIEISQKNQIFITTHSPNFLLRDDKICAIYKIEKNEASSEIKRISDDELLTIFKDLDLGLYDYILYDGILFVEGKKDLKVFDKIMGEVFQPKFKLIQIEGKLNLVHYASAKILQYLDRNSLNFLFLLDRDRGNEDFYKRIENDDVREFIKDRILNLFSYELENIFVQPILIIDYLNYLNIIETLNSDFVWLLDVIDDIFQSLGKNYYEYLLKKFNDILFPSLKKEEIKTILKKTNQLSDFDEIIDIWKNEINSIYESKLTFLQNPLLNKDIFKSKLIEFQDIYDKLFSNKKYNKIISGKYVFKKLNQLLANKYRLGNLNIESLAEHFVYFIDDYILFYKEKRTKKLTSIKEEEKNLKVDWLDSQIIDDFISYCSEFITLINKIKEELNCDLKNDKNYDNLDFSLMYDFLNQRWQLNDEL